MPIRILKFIIINHLLFATLVLLPAFAWCGTQMFAFGWASFLGAMVGIIAGIILIESLFRIGHRLMRGRPFVCTPLNAADKIYVEPHPYMPYSYKRNAITAPAQQTTYPLHQEVYTFPQLTTSSQRYLNGPGGDRNIITPKPDGLFRVACLGASTTGNYLQYEGENCSYPLALERLLHKRFTGRQIEVNNCGMGGRTSAEILIDFALNIIDTQPDMIVLYHAYNDLRPSMVEPFASDYSHARTTLGETYSQFKFISKLPDLPLHFYHAILAKLFPYTNIRNDMLRAISKGTVSMDASFAGTETYKRNLAHIINLCQANNIKVVCATFAYHMHGTTAEDTTVRKYFDGVQLENEAMSELAREHDLPLVDVAERMPKEDRYFMDTIHFSHEGMDYLAKLLAEPITDSLNEKPA